MKKLFYLVGTRTPDLPRPVQQTCQAMLGSPGSHCRVYYVPFISCAIA